VVELLVESNKVFILKICDMLRLATRIPLVLSSLEKVFIDLMHEGIIRV